MIPLKIKQRALHARPINAVLIQGLIVYGTIALTGHDALQIHDPRIELAESDDAIIDYRRRLQSNPMFRFHRKSAAAQIGNVILVLLVIASVHFEMDMLGACSDITLRTE